MRENITTNSLEIQEVRTCDFCKIKESPTVWHSILMCKYCGRDACKECGKYCTCFDCDLTDYPDFVCNICSHLRYEKYGYEYEEEGDRNFKVLTILDNKIREESLNTKT